MTLDEVYNALYNRFKKWKIVLPYEEFMARQPHDQHYTASWTIKYTFGEDQWGEFIDVYKNHRHPGPDAYRFYWVTGKMFQATTYDEVDAIRFNQYDKIYTFMDVADPPTVGLIKGLSWNPF